MTIGLRHLLAGLVLTVVALAAVACGDDEKKSGDAQGTGSVSFSEPSDGDTVKSPVRVVMKAAGFTIEPAGEVRARAGHFHIVVDTSCVDTGQTIPSDANHLHFGKAQTEAEVELAPGKHRLCLQAGDGAHSALDLTDEIEVTVES